MKPAPLHDRIRRDVEARIMSGAWEAGRRLPTEQALMAEYACSRMTVNKALSALVGFGMIERRRRAGSFVAAPTVHRAVVEIPDVAAEIESRGNSHGLDLLRHVEREATADDCRRLLIAGGPVLDLACLHRAGLRPFALERRLINLTLVPAARTVNFARESPGRWLLEHVPWTDATHRISATIAGPDAALLGVAAEAPCLTIERWTWRTRERLTYVRQTYSGDHALLSVG
ncbi:UTRA domain-containing protein [Sphingomonas sp.]|uniref:UTRA domain-containing protein n=1 Tax=Sphingomonas sp. TaxID=28214 RepID=UPI0035C80941